MREARGLWEPRGGNWPSFKVRETSLEEGMSKLRRQTRAEPADRLGGEFQESRPACAKARGKQEPDSSAESQLERV